MDQGMLWGSPGGGPGTPKLERPAVPNNPKKRDLRAEAESWMRARPEATALFMSYARDLAAKGKKFGVKLIAERVRYEHKIQGWADFAVNNNHTAYIARWMIAREPKLEQFLEFRETSY
jgi:hypothetical protein